MPKTTKPNTKASDRRKISEALLADRLGLNEPWIERWEERGKWREESCAPDRLPDFIRKNYKKREVEDIENDIERLVAAGCRRQVAYFCLAQLSPEATRLRAGDERKPVFRRGDEDTATDADYFALGEQRLSTREDLEAVSDAAKAARKQIHRYQLELMLIAEAANYPLPSGFCCRPESPVDALTLLADSLTWAAPPPTPHHLSPRS